MFFNKFKFQNDINFFLSDFEFYIVCIIYRSYEFVGQKLPKFFFIK